MMTSIVVDFAENRLHQARGVRTVGRTRVLGRYPRDMLLTVEHTLCNVMNRTEMNTS